MLKPFAKYIYLFLSYLTLLGLNFVDKHEYVCLDQLLQHEKLLTFLSESEIQSKFSKK